MATKKQTLTGLNLSNPLARTEQAEPEEAGSEKAPHPVGVYLSSVDKKALDDIAAAHNLNRHQLLQYSVQLFLKQYRAGTLKIETEQKAGRVLIKR